MDYLGSDMEVLNSRDIIMIVFAAGGVISTITYCVSVIKSLVSKVEGTNNRVQHLEVSMGKMETKMDIFSQEMRRLISEMKPNKG